MKLKLLYIFIPLSLIFSGILILFCKDSAVSAGSGVKWFSFNAGIKRAKITKRPIIIDFYADWCSWCIKMDKDLFHNHKIVKKLAKEFVTIRVNTDKPQKINFQNKVFNPQQLSAYFGVKGLPTIVFLDSNGKPITKLPGYVQASVFVLVLDYIREECYQKITFDDYVNKKVKCKKK